MPVEVRLVSALEKVFTDEAPPPYPDISLVGLKGELLSFQAAYTLLPPGDIMRQSLRVEVQSQLPCTVRRVAQMPVRFARQPGTDDDYLRDQPGLYPDALIDLPENALIPVYLNQWDALWVDVMPAEYTAAGEYSVKLSFYDDRQQLAAQVEQPFTVLDAVLPPQTLIHTRWMHYDALADAYGVEVFSEKHFTLVERMIAHAVQRGINMVLVPIHTPPLDTRQGTERATAQLVDVQVKDGRYAFGFDKLHRFVDICRAAGVQYFEMAHLFTQWGAFHAPKIMGTRDGRLVRLFGWDTDALGDGYRDFLSQYLPALTAELERLGIADRTYFHISDEPSTQNIGQYTAVREMVAPYLQGFPIMDALSDIRFYESGAVALPVPAIDHMEAFTQADIQERWTYYCVAQHTDVPNTFLAMPANRTRILGVLLYRYGIKGFLQWAHNFYYAQYADYYTDPWYITDADGFAPAGDAFQIYPGRDGWPKDSLRLMLFQHAVQDMRALEALEERIGRERVLQLIAGEAGRLPTYTDYPRNAEFLLRLRARMTAAWTGAN